MTTIGRAVLGAAALLMGLLAPLVPAVGAGLQACGPKPARDPCGCADRDDLLNRIAIAHAAIDHLRAEMAAMGTAKVDEIKTGTTITLKDALKESIKEAQAQVQKHTARDVIGETDGVTCGPRYQADTK